MSDRRFAEITAVLQRYFEGLYKCDTAILREVLHPEALYATASEGPLTCLDMERYMPIIETRTSPASNDEPRIFEIDSISFAGPVTALAWVRITMLSKRYNDVLTLLCIDERWWIMSKIFHVETL
jgi:hypothetical protein